jgi:hypothetical protein
MPEDHTKRASTGWGMKEHCLNTGTYYPTANSCNAKRTPKQHGDNLKCYLGLDKTDPRWEPYLIQFLTVIKLSALMLRFGMTRRHNFKFFISWELAQIISMFKARLCLCPPVGVQTGVMSWQSSGTSRTT